MQTMKPIMAAAYDLYGKRFGDGVLNALSASDTPAMSNTFRPGAVVYPHPLNIEAVLALKDISGHHSSCIQAKKYVTVGLGFIDSSDEIDKTSAEGAIEKVATLLSGQGHVESEVDKALDPLTNFGFMNELLDAGEDFYDTGTGYLEVCRNRKWEITGISHVPARDIHACTYNGRVYFQYDAPMGMSRYFAMFGKRNKQWLLSKDGPFNAPLKEEEVSEIIPFIQPSNRVKYYGYPDWVSASVDIDLLRKAKQYKADFYHNRGVLDKILVVTGESVEQDAWEDIQRSLKQSIGEGKNFRSFALNLGNENAKVEIRNIGAEGKDEEQFAKDNETLTQNIVSSHRVPPLLANILIPGKLGASNEFVSALIGFQLLVVHPQQQIFQKMLAKTLAGPDGVDGLKPDSFLLRTITSQINLRGIDTLGRMREEAAGADRDLDDGVKD